MKLDAVTVKFPEQRISVDETIDLIKFHSQDDYQGNLATNLNAMRKTLELTGAKERRWMGEEKPIELIQEAVKSALKEANCSKNDIDLVMYTGVGRGFLEPGSAYFIAQSMGMHYAECFDVLDACMSWSRALNIAFHYLKSKTHQKILIVNGEFNHTQEFVKDHYCVSNLTDFENKFAAFTIGNATTATVVSADDTASWEWHFSSRTDLADLCTLQLPNANGFTTPSKRIPLNMPFQFRADTALMHQKGQIELAKIFKRLSVPINDVKRIFPHASAKTPWQLGAKALGVDDKMFYVYPMYGNLVSASVPAGIALAKQEQLVYKGDQIICWVGSAGMSFSIYSFKL